MITNEERLTDFLKEDMITTQEQLSCIDRKSSLEAYTVYYE